MTRAHARTLVSSAVLMSVVAGHDQRDADLVNFRHLKILTLKKLGAREALAQCARSGDLHRVPHQAWCF